MFVLSGSLSPSTGATCALTWTAPLSVPSEKYSPARWSVTRTPCIGQVITGPDSVQFDGFHTMLCGPVMVIVAVYPWAALGPWSTTKTTMPPPLGGTLDPYGPSIARSTENVMVTWDVAVALVTRSSTVTRKLLG